MILITYKEFEKKEISELRNNYFSSLINFFLIIKIFKQFFRKNSTKVNCKIRLSFILNEKKNF